jgi:micrococcal nuclease
MKLLAAAMIGFFLGFVPECRGCECSGGDPKFHLKNADVVFEGWVESMQIRTHALFEGMTLTKRTTTTYMVFTLKVGRVYKGSPPKSVKVATGIGTADGTAAPDCSFPFETGKDYLVYAQSGMTEYGGLLYTSICSGTGMINGARFFPLGTESNLRYLQGRPPRKEDQLSYEEFSKAYESRATAQISGKIIGKEAHGLLQYGFWRLIDGEWHEWTSPDIKPDGSYAFAYLEPGEYRIGFFQIHEDGLRQIGFYGEAERLEDARSIFVGPKSHIKGIDITLKPQSRHVVQGKIDCLNQKIPNRKIKIKIANRWDPYKKSDTELVLEECSSFRIPEIYSGKFRVIASMESEVVDPLDAWTVTVPEIKVPEEASDVLIRINHERLSERAASPAYPVWDIWEGKVRQIIDGDKIIVELGSASNRKAKKLRIARIRCPQKGQYQWEEAKKLTATLLLGKTKVFSMLQSDSGDNPMEYEDSPGIYVGVPMAAVEDIAKTLVKAGLAWHYRKYSADPELDKLESEARKAGRGIWAKPDSR